MRSKISLYALFDVFSVSLIFGFFLLIKADPFIKVFSDYFYYFLIFIGIWIAVSFFVDKYNFDKIPTVAQLIKHIIFTNLLIVGITTSLMYLMRVDHFSRTVVFGTILTSTGVEIIWFTIMYLMHTAKPEQLQNNFGIAKNGKSLLKRSAQVFSGKAHKSRDFKSREEAIMIEVDQKAFEFIFSYAVIDSPDTLIISTTSDFNIKSRLEEKFDSVINLKRINDIRYINKFFEAVNSKLPNGGLFIDFVESKNLRKKRILRKYPPGLNYIAYTLDFVIKRVFPKFSLTKGIYFFLTRGQNRVITKAETFGRLYSCGFEIIDEGFFNNHLYFVARKVSEPVFPEDPTYGPLVKLERIGFKGELMKVYKFRTMHPYAEYLQEYIYKNGGLKEGGKFKSDFRITTVGRIMRTFWLDELPMLINLFRSDLKIVGVRPLSSQYFSLYGEEFQKRRINYRPGLIPPFYVDYPKTLEAIIESEKRYLNAYDNHPLRTDIKYFFKAIFNIILKRYRSN